MKIRHCSVGTDQLINVIITLPLDFVGLAPKTRDFWTPLVSAAATPVVPPAAPLIVSKMVVIHLTHR